MPSRGAFSSALRHISLRCLLSVCVPCLCSHHGACSACLALPSAVTGGLCSQRCDRHADGDLGPQDVRGHCFEYFWSLLRHLRHDCDHGNTKVTRSNPAPTVHFLVLSPCLAVRHGSVGLLVQLAGARDGPRLCAARVARDRHLPAQLHCARQPAAAWYGSNISRLSTFGRSVSLLADDLCINTIA
jgi:hypothetical protein